MGQDGVTRALGVVAGLLGATGVGLAAAAAHLDQTRLLASAAAICLAHAPALLALSLAAPRGRLGVIGGVMIALGAILFAGDVALLAFVGHGLFPRAAPTGGMLLMAGWLVLSLSALVRRHN